MGIIVFILYQLTVCNSILYKDNIYKHFVDVHFSIYGRDINQTLIIASCILCCAMQTDKCDQFSLETAIQFKKCSLEI